MDRNEGIGHLSSEDLQKILDTINLRFDHPICIGNAKGYIVASYHRRSTGQLHGGFVKILNQNLSELLLYEDHEIPGILKGVNYPLVIGHKVVGMVGISGDVEQVSYFSGLIRILLEQSIQAADNEYQRSSAKRMYSNFIYEWLLEAHSDNDEDFQTRGRMLGINTNVPRYVAVLDMHQDASLLHDPSLEEQETLSLMSILNEQLADRIRDFLTARDPQHCCAMVGDTYVLLLRQHSSDSIHALLSELQQELTVSLKNQQCFIGVGMLATVKEDVRNSYHQARLASNIASQTPKLGSIIYYGSLDLQLLVFSAPQRYKKELFDRVFKDFTKEEVRDAVELIHTYIDTNGSLKRCAEALFIHKNSLQYRLNRFARQTGYDLRNLSDISFLAALASIYDMGMEL